MLKSLYMSKLLLFFTGGLLLLNFACQSSNDESKRPNISLEDYVLEPGFQLDLVAAEPLLRAPVAMDFDAAGRIWVVEMQGYMQNIDGTEEETPNGQILILADQDQDGYYETRSVFLDQLVLPRALALVYGGLLYAEPPNLWFVEIEGDQPGKRTLVDSVYAVGGNVEHQPNGLLMNLDNWIYNAKSTARYRLKNGQWEKEQTRFRGQWGITHDDYGQLFYNDNSNQLMGDYMMPNLLGQNPHAPAKRGQYQSIARDQRVYPLQATAVNRGYMDGMLHENGYLKNFTSACGPLIYRGDQFPEEYYGNAFVCGPEVNLVKRNIISREGIPIRATQAWEGKEFLASKDKAFRPVNLYNGPDGALYLVDMHRGIIQHKTYMTAYLREKLVADGLDTIINAGRILRISYTGNADLVRLDQKTEKELVTLLQHPNGWVRDRAQHRLVSGGNTTLVPDLEVLALGTNHPLAQLHALWTLEGLNALSKSLLTKVAKTSSAEVQVSAIQLLVTPFGKIAPDLSQQLLAAKHPVVDLQLGIHAGLSEDGDFTLLAQLLERYPQDTLLMEATLSGLLGKEERFRDYLQEQQGYAQTKPMIQFLTQTLQKSREPQNLASGTLHQDGLTRGRDLYLTHCSSCHAPGGQGIDNLAPPIYHSEYLEGDPRKVALVILHGLQGPVHVKGKRYEMNTVMPGLKQNPELDNQKIADIVSYVRNAFSQKPHNVSAELIEDCRGILPKENLFTEAEVMAY